MSQAQSLNSRSIFLLDSTDLLDDGGAADRRVAVNGDVTVSATPDASGKMVWEARGADGKKLRVFNLKIEPIMARGPVVVPAEPGSVYVCYEDENLQKSWCLKVRTD